MPGRQELPSTAEFAGVYRFLSLAAHSAGNAASRQIPGFSTPIMKITGPGAIRPSAPRRASRTVEYDSGNFSSQLSVDEVTSPAVASAGPLTAVQSLLAIQEVPDATQSRKRAVKRGNDLLDQLDQIRLALLTGSISPDRLRHLARQLREPRPPSLDPNLAQLMDDIELRVAVELAKLGF